MPTHTPGPCQCSIEMGDDNWQLIVYCPLHAAAPRMLGALKDALTTIEARCRVEGIAPDASPTVVLLKEVIREATE